MKAIDIIRWSLRFADEGTARLASDMREIPLTQPTPCGGNHPLWVVGHLAFVEGNLPTILLGLPNPVAHWAPMFAPGTECKADASLYPPFDEVLKTLRDLRAKNLKLLDEIGDEGLERVPVKIPPGFEKMMRTFGHTFQMIALHQMGHYGQITDARRAAGHKPFM